jgi:hypothetical protein
MVTAKDLVCSGCKDKYFYPDSRIVGRLNVEPPNLPAGFGLQWMLGRLLTRGNIKPAIFVYLFLRLLPNNAHCHVMIWALLLNTPMCHS